jgi:hypothetical protein
VGRPATGPPAKAASLRAVGFNLLEISMADSTLTPRALRKLRRRAENDFYAKDARFWAGKIKSADRMQYDRPADRNSHEELRPTLNR